MAQIDKQLLTRSPLDGCRPANQVGPGPEKEKDLAVSRGSGLQPAIHAPSVGISRVQRGRWRGEPVHRNSTGLCELLACWPIFLSARQDLMREIGLQRWWLADVDGPQRTANGGQILWVGNFLMPEKLGPGTVGGITEIVGQLTDSISSASRLRYVLLQKRESGDRHVGTQSRGWRCPASTGEVLHPNRPVIIWRPVLARHLGRSVSVQLPLVSLKPASDPDVIVRSGQVADHEGKEMKSARYHVGRGAAS